MSVCVIFLDTPILYNKFGQVFDFVSIQVKIIISLIINAVCRV